MAGNPADLRSPVQCALDLFLRILGLHPAPRRGGVLGRRARARTVVEAGRDARPRDSYDAPLPMERRALASGSPSRLDRRSRDAGPLLDGSTPKPVAMTSIDIALMRMK